MYNKKQNWENKIHTTSPFKIVSCCSLLTIPIAERYIAAYLSVLIKSWGTHIYSSFFFPTHHPGELFSTLYGEVMVLVCTRILYVEHSETISSCLKPLKETVYFLINSPDFESSPKHGLCNRFNNLLLHTYFQGYTAFENSWMFPMYRGSILAN